MLLTAGIVCRRLSVCAKTTGTFKRTKGCNEQTSSTISLFLKMLRFYKMKVLSKPPKNDQIVPQDQFKITTF